MTGFLISALILFLPAVFQLEILFDFRPWVLLVLLGFIFFTHPKMSFEKLGSDGKSEADKQSMFYINLAFYISIIPIYYYYLFFIFTPNNTKEIYLIEIIGIILGFIGVLFRWWSIKVLGQWFTSEVIIQSDHKLVKHGPYKWIRHPGYTGALLFGLTVPLIFNIPYGLIWSLSILLPAYYYRISVEEKTLKDHFGDEYLLYKQTSWKLFPLVW